MRHIDHQVCAAGVGNFPQLFEIDRAWISARAGNNQLRLYRARPLHQLVVIDSVRYRINAVSDKIVVSAGHIDGRAVRQVTALRKIHAEHGVARLQKGKVHGEVGLCAGMRLNVRVLRAEQPARTLTRNVLHDIHILTAAVIAVRRISFRVFIGQNRAHGRHDRRGNNILRSNQLKVAALALEFQLHGLAQLRIRLRNKTDRIQKITIHMKSVPSQ